MIELMRYHSSHRIPNMTMFKANANLARDDSAGHDLFIWMRSCMKIDHWGLKGKREAHNSERKHIMVATSHLLQETGNDRGYCNTGFRPISNSFLPCRSSRSLFIRHIEAD